MRESCWRGLNKMPAISGEFWKKGRPILAFQSYMKFSGAGPFRKRRKYEKSSPDLEEAHVNI